MTTVFITGLVVLGVIIIAVVWYITGYNGFVHLHNMVQEAWSGIDVQLKRRYDLIPNLVETVKGYSFHEKTVLETVTQMRSVSMHATTIEQKVQAEVGLTSALKTLFAVAENYPDLKANQNFLKLQDELKNIEHDLQLARRYYNGTARNYNIKVQSFPATIIARNAGFAAVPYFELSQPAERETPHVKF